MIALTLSIAFTLGVSAFCSLLEALILSTRPAEIEALKGKHPRKGELLERFRENIEETSSAILSLNTIANTLGATLVGGLSVEVFSGEHTLLVFSGGMTLGILLFSEIIPKNIAVLYRPSLQPHLIYPLWAVRFSMLPFSLLGKQLVRLLVGNKREPETSDEDIILMAERSAKEGVLTLDESQIISNVLNLDEVTLHEIMTPRTVVTAVNAADTVGSTVEHFDTIPHARLPVYKETVDNTIGMVRRKDILQAHADTGDNSATMESLMQPIPTFNENLTADEAMKTFIESNQQLGVVVDEFGTVTGVISLEDILESLLGKEIFEKDDMAVDMRELAKERRANKEAQQGA